MSGPHPTSEARVYIVQEMSLQARRNVAAGAIVSTTRGYGRVTRATRRALHVTHIGTGETFSVSRVRLNGVVSISVFLPGVLS